MQRSEVVVIVFGIALGHWGQHFVIFKGFSLVAHGHAQ